MSLGETDDESVSAGTSPPGINYPAILLSIYNLRGGGEFCKFHVIRDF